MANILLPTYGKNLVSFFVPLLIFVHFASALASSRGTKGILDTHSIRVDRGWNLMSVPVTITDGRKSSIFPTAISSAFIYQHGYELADTLQNGQGFWVKFDSASTVSLGGNAIFDDTIAVASGWNIVGSLTMPIAVKAIHSQPSGIIASLFFGYVPGVGYQVTDTLQPGRGYWVKVRQSGSIILFADTVVLDQSVKEPENLQELTSVQTDSNHLVLTFANGNSLPSYNLGDILVGDSAGGYARKVTGVTVNGNQVTVETEKASLDEVVTVANVDTTYDITFPSLAALKRYLAKPLIRNGKSGGKTYSIVGSTPLISLSPNANLLTLKFPNVNLDIATPDGYGHASIGVDTLTFSLEAKISSFTLKYCYGLEAFRFVTQVTPSIRFDGVTILVSGVIDMTDSLPFVSGLLLGVIPTPIPGLVLTPEFNLFAGLTPSFSMNAGLQSTGAVEIGGTQETGFDYENGIFNPVWNTSIFGSNTTVFSPTASFQGGLEVFLKPSIDCRIDGTIGVGVFVKPYEYNQISYPPLAAEIGVGVSGGVSASMKIFSQYLFDMELTLADFRKKLFSSSGPNYPSNPSPDSAATNISTSPTLTWFCTDPGGDPLTYDAYFGTDNPPATKVDSNLATASLSRSGLSSSTTYYWKVVAKDNHSNSTTGPVWRFTTAGGSMGTPCPGRPTVSHAGKIYNTVLIGTQCWLKENLDVGTMIQGSQDQTNNSIIEKYCYNDDTAYCTTYGGLYQWNEAMEYSTTAGTRGICPSGWHIPTQTEFQTLASTVSSDGNALKEVGQGTGGGAGTNASGFSALLAGYRYLDGYFVNLGRLTIFWSSTEGDASGACYLTLISSSGFIFLFVDYVKDYGFSVRCLED